MKDRRHLPDEDLGLTLRPGDQHYRAYVGPPIDYDLIAAMTFNLLTSLGLRQYHRLLDIGCGSLRVGRLLIPYLNRGNYFGVEPNQWLVREGIEKELGSEQIILKSPNFSYKDSLTEFKDHLGIDYAVAQSIYSHAGKDVISRWLGDVSFHLTDTGALVATFIESDIDFDGDGWIYPGCVGYRFETIVELARSAQLMVQKLDWHHPRQTWVIFHKGSFVAELCSDGQVSWNKTMMITAKP
ncbi:MAG: class I SAM-dependent methyltransferase [Saprospiraceae bacterium]|nr:class I SAM-dependent methyltransferase [Saprospiraceae bacterium]